MLTISPRPLPISPDIGIAPIQPNQPVADQNIALEEERDQLDVHSTGPRVFFQVLEERVEEVGGQKILNEVVEERVEVDGQTIQSTFKRLKQNLGEVPEQASGAIGQLDVDRIRALLLDG